MNSPRTIVITGASDGIGAVAARALAGPEVNLVVVGRSAQKLAAVAADTGATALTADFAELDQVRSLAQQIRDQVGTIDVLMNNAGGTFAPHPRTADGHEPNFGINHLTVPADQPAARPAGRGRRVAGAQHLQRREPIRTRRPR